MYHPKNRNRHVPAIPVTEHKEMPVVEELVTLHHLHDKRPEVVKPYENVMHPQMNRLYGTLRVEEGWKDTVDNYAKGGITTIAATTVASNVVLAQTFQETRLSRWPGAIQLYLAIRSFSMVASTATFATAGSLDVYYQDTIGGQIIPLGSISNNDELNMYGASILIPTPITDAGSLNNASGVGQIQVALSSGATVGTYIWQIAFSYAYLLPTTKPYDVQHIEDLLDMHPGHARNEHS